MSSTWREDDEEFKVGGGGGGGGGGRGLRAKPRFSFTEVKLLLEAVKRNRYIILRKFNQGVSAETKKQTWTEITNQINGLGENHREVRSESVHIMKKWADLKCDGKRRIAALRGPNGSNLRKKRLGPVERMVHKILMMSPRGDGDSDLDLGEDDDGGSALGAKGSSSNPLAYSYLSLADGSPPGGASYDISPLSSPEKDLGGESADATSSDPAPSSVPPPPAPPAPGPADPLPAGASSRRSRDQVAQLATQSLQQQRASRMLLTSVSRSLEVLAQSVQLLVESQQEFVQESLLLQRETVDVLRDFSNTALTMLRDKANSGHLVAHHPPR
uniref:Wiskott-Aldrich syndrome protein family member 2-like n=1 Tax=Stegastes partitus TaxID=144197 RepID=A0A3B5BGX9_9TELE